MVTILMLLQKFEIASLIESVILEDQTVRNENFSIQPVLHVEGQKNQRVRKLQFSIKVRLFQKILYNLNEKGERSDLRLKPF